MSLECEVYEHVGLERKWRALARMSRLGFGMFSTVMYTTNILDASLTA